LENVAILLNEEIPGDVIAVAPQIRNEMKSKDLKMTVVGLNGELRDEHNRIGITTSVSQIVC